MNLQQSEQTTTSRPTKPPHACTHGRLISDNVTEEEQHAGKVRCVECDTIVPDPYLKREGKKT